jgi:hypothetical protein
LKGLGLTSVRVGIQKWVSTFIFKVIEFWNYKINQNYKSEKRVVMENEFKQYRKSQTAELRPYMPGQFLDPEVLISPEDLKNGSPKPGDMIARNPKNHKDQWLVAGQYFKDNFEELGEKVFDFDIGNAKMLYQEKDIRERNIIGNKILRVELDKNLQNLKLLPGSRERSLAITKLQEAIMWLGMDLKRMNETNLYPDSYNPENTNIDPTAEGLKL